MGAAGRRGPWLGWGTAAVFAALHVGLLLALQARLPDPFGIHWGPDGRVDGLGSIWLHLGLGAAGILLAVGLGAGPATWRGSGSPALLGFGVAVGGLVTAMLLAGTLGQVDRPEALGAPFGWPVLIGGGALAIAWGVACAKLCRAGEKEAARTEPAAPERAVPGPADGQVPPAGTAVASAVRAPAWIQIVLAVPVVLVAAMMVATGEWGALAVLVPVIAIVAAAALLLRGTVVADDDGVRVYGSGFLRFLTTAATQVRSAEACEIAALDYGGWGLRVSGRGVGYITGDGPALVVRRRSGADRIYSVATLQDAQRMAAVLNRRAGKNQ